MNFSTANRAGKQYADSEVNSHGIHTKTKPEIVLKKDNTDTCFKACACSCPGGCPGSCPGGCPGGCPDFCAYAVPSEFLGTDLVKVL